MSKHKVIPFPQTPFDDFIDELSQLNRENRLTDFICMFSNSYKEGEEVEGFSSEMRNYWFGKTSTLTCLGLTDVMKDIILEYMREKQNEQ